MLVLDRLTAAIEKAFLYLTGLGLMGIMMVIVVDVIMRYFFSAPLSWSYDLIGMYLVTLVFFLALADTFRCGGHIKVELFENLRSKRLFAVAEIICYISSLVFFALILMQMIESGIEGMFAGEVVDGAIPWPTWPPYLIAALGVALLMIRVTLNVIRRIAALASSRVYEQEGGNHLHVGHVE